MVDNAFVLLTNPIHFNNEFAQCFSYFNFPRWFVSFHQYFCKRNCNASWNSTAILSHLVNIKPYLFVNITQHKLSSSSWGGIFSRGIVLAFAAILISFSTRVFKYSRSAFIKIFILWVIMSYSSCNWVLICAFIYT